MSNIYVTFKNGPTLQLDIQDTDLGNRYVELVKQNYQQQFPLFRDIAKYNIDYMRTLVEQAHKILGWDWNRDFHDPVIANLLHKDIEILLGIGGFDNVREEEDQLLHEIHYCLHLVQNPRHKLRQGWLQIEWYNDNGFSLPADFTFTKLMKFGDIKLQNPYVGHHPLQIYLEKDFSNIGQTCKLHDFVKPGINIVIEDFNHNVDNDIVMQHLKSYDSNFVNEQSEERIRKFIGYPGIGRVVNQSDLIEILKLPVLELESLRFD